MVLHEKEEELHCVYRKWEVSITKKPAQMGWFIFYNTSVCSLSFSFPISVDLWNIDVTASTPNKLVLHMNSISAIWGASTFVNVHHKQINTLTIHPVNPQTLLLEIDLFPVNNCIQNSLCFIISSLSANLQN